MSADSFDNACAATTPPCVTSDNSDHPSVWTRLTGAKNQRRIQAAQIKAMIAFKTVEIVSWGDNGHVSHAWICQHLEELRWLYEEFEELTEHVLEEILEDVPRWQVLIEWLGDMHIIRHTVGFEDEFEPYDFSTIETATYDPHRSLWRAFFGHRYSATDLQHAAEAADLVADIVAEELVGTAVTITELSFTHDTLTWMEQQETERLLNEFVDILVADPAVAAQMLGEDDPPSSYLPGSPRLPRSLKLLRNRGHTSYTATSHFVTWSHSRNRCEFLDSDAEDWTYSDVRDCEKFMKEGFRVKLHQVPLVTTMQYFDPEDDQRKDGAPRVARYDRIARLSDDGNFFSMFIWQKTSSDEGRLVLDEENQLQLSDIEVVCECACTQLLHQSLESMNGSFDCLDSTEQAHRCVSLISKERSLDFEIRPSSMRYRAERVAARRLAHVVALSLQRMVMYERSEKGMLANLMLHKNVLSGLPPLTRPESPHTQQSRGWLRSASSGSSGGGSGIRVETGSDDSKALKTYFSWQSINGDFG